MAATKQEGIHAGTLDQTIKKLEEKLGRGSIHTGDKVEDVYRLPGRSANFNYATEGGIPFGRFSHFWGSPKANKSTMAYELISQAQQVPHSIERYLMPRIRYYREMGDTPRVEKLMAELEFYKDNFPDGVDAVLYNVEQVYDKKYAARKGIDVDRLLVIESTMTEDIVMAMEGLYPRIPMHVVDSTSNATSYEEQKMAMTDRRMGLDARVWKQTLRKSLRYWNRPDGLNAAPRDFNIGILVTQVSTNLRTGGEQPVSAKFISHTSAMTLRFQLGRYLWRMDDGQLKEDKPTGADESSLAGRAEPDGRQIFVEVDKSRVCRLGRIAALQADFRSRDFDHLWEMVNAAVHFGIAQQSASYYKIDGDEKSVQGIRALRARIDEDPDLQDRIMAALMAHLDDD